MFALDAFAGDVAAAPEAVAPKLVAAAAVAVPVDAIAAFQGLKLIKLIRHQQQMQFYKPK